ncbi:MAG: PduL/EutD family phosphate acyltransferase, partial [Actinomycetia bacterium]|nr:PduL/EutD family phosphate acyltransferase [Actinomycetes bacterium]
MSQQSSAKRPGGNQPSGSVRPDMIEEIARRVVARVVERADPMTVPVGVSVRHVHLSRADLRTLFGLDEFTLYRPVVQPGEFAATEMVAVRGPKGGFERVRCMGPCRPQSQVELSRTDAFALGVDAP